MEVESLNDASIVGLGECRQSPQPRPGIRKKQLADPDGVDGHSRFLERFLEDAATMEHGHQRMKPAAIEAADDLEQLPLPSPELERPDDVEDADAAHGRKLRGRNTASRIPGQNPVP